MYIMVPFTLIMFYYLKFFFKISACLYSEIPPPTPCFKQVSGKITRHTHTLSTFILITYMIGFIPVSFTLSTCCQELWRSEILSYVQACYSFMDAGRRHKTPWSETNDFITHNNSSCQSIIICTNSQNCPSFHRTSWREPRDICTYPELCYRREILILGNPIILYWAVSLPDLCQRKTLFLLHQTVNKPSLCSEEGHNLYISRLLSIQAPLKIYFGTNRVSGFAQKMCKKTWETQEELYTQHLTILFFLWCIYFLTVLINWIFYSPVFL